VRGSPCTSSLDIRPSHGASSSPVCSGVGCIYAHWPVSILVYRSDGFAMSSPSRRPPHIYDPLISIIYLNYRHNILMKVPNCVNRVMGHVDCVQFIMMCRRSKCSKYGTKEKVECRQKPLLRNRQESIYKSAGLVSSAVVVSDASCLGDSPWCSQRYSGASGRTPKRAGWRSSLPWSTSLRACGTCQTSRSLFS